MLFRSAMFRTVLSLVTATLFHLLMLPLYSTMLLILIFKSARTAKPGLGAVQPLGATTGSSDEGATSGRHSYR